MRVAACVAVRVAGFCRVCTSVWYHLLQVVAVCGSVCCSACCSTCCRFLKIYVVVRVAEHVLVRVAVHVVVRVAVRVTAYYSVLQSNCVFCSVLTCVAACFVVS